MSLIFRRRTIFEKQIHALKREHNHVLLFACTHPWHACRLCIDTCKLLYYITVVGLCWALNSETPAMLGQFCNVSINFNIDVCDQEPPANMDIVGCCHC